MQENSLFLDQDLQVASDIEVTYLDNSGVPARILWDWNHREGAIRHIPTTREIVVPDYCSECSHPTQKIISLERVLMMLVSKPTVHDHDEGPDHVLYSVWVRNSHGELHRFEPE